jgi:hypothetical protein
MPHKHLGTKWENRPSLHAIKTVAVDPEFGVDNEPMNVQMTLKENFRRTMTHFFKTFT